LSMLIFSSLLLRSMIRHDSLKRTFLRCNIHSPEDRVAVRAEMFVLLVWVPFSLLSDHDVFYQSGTRCL
jgi:hypothetical protein